MKPLHLCFVAIILLSIDSTACRMVSLEKNPEKYIYKMIKNTPDIYIAEALSYSKEDESFSFKIIETVRGEKKEMLTLGGLNIADHADLAIKATNDFSNHKAADFWSNIITGRTTFGPDCRLNPAFQVGSRYLIFNKEPFQAKSFELIKSKKDRWYVHVVETLYPPKKVKKVEVAPTAPTGESPTSTAPAVTPEVKPESK